MFRAVISIFIFSIMVSGLGLAQQALDGDELAAAVEGYLAEPDEAQASALLKVLLSKNPTLDAVLAVLSRPQRAFSEKFEMVVPFEGRAVRIQVECPEAHSPDSQALPVVMQLRLKRIPDTVRVPGVINAWPLDFDPELKSESLRDGAVKFAHCVASRTNGDPGRLWLSGFSTGGHASFDVALRRPGVFRGIVPMAGAPSRPDFRLLENLRERSVFAVVGTKDDRELIWNLDELYRRHEGVGFDYSLGKDDQVEGRLNPSPHYTPMIAPHITSKASLSSPEHGIVVADEAGICSDMFEIMKVSKSMTKIPERVAVPAKLGPDECRRFVVDATIDSRAAFDWSLELGPNKECLLHIDTRGVTRARLYLRRSWLGTADVLLLQEGDRKRPRRLKVTPDLETLLVDLRRSGRRHDPCLATLDLRF